MDVIRLDPKTERLLNRLARRKGRTRSMIIRDAGQSL
ncbi:MAG: ribbon-helix-helix protein, CopG family [Candidatus Rokubacteria bacterium]|nr:ribbon-helix-helix protein, CopG family [Candidatus Rokubacteria bacterium]